MDKYSYIREVKNFIEQFVDNADIISTNVVQYNCVMCGRSKNNEPHMRINYENGVYYCYRCNEGDILLELIKQFKNTSNREYVNSLLKLYFSYYEYNSKDKRIKRNQDYQSYEFSLNNLPIDSVKNDNINSTQFKFLQSRFPSISDPRILQDILNKFKININNNSNRIYYNSFHRKFAYSYLINDDLTYVKEKITNGNIVNDRKDYYYLISNYANDNLYISEGLIDLVTLYITDPLYNANDSNYLALCCRNYKMLYDILVNSGKFFYKNIYIILDNDINEHKFLDGIISILLNNTNRSKYKLYNNLYTITVPYEYVDLNKYYLHDHTIKDILIKKVH